MIQWPNIGLWGQFEACETGILEKINLNFELLDTLTQLKVIDFVDEPPSGATLGDRYILIDDTNSYTNDVSAIIVFDGDDWNYIPAREGYLAYVEGQGFFWFNGVEWVSLFVTNDVQIDLPNNASAYGTGIFLDETKYVHYRIRLTGFREDDTPLERRATIIFDVVYKAGTGWLTPEYQMSPEDLGVTAVISANEFCINTTNYTGGSYVGKATLKILDQSQVEV